MAKQLKSYSLHILLFVIVEVLFVFILFREIPETNIFTAIGVGHTLYWGVLLISAFLRKHVQRVWQKFLTTYAPIVAHLAIHLWIGAETLHVYEDHHTQDTLWIVLGVIGAGIFIYRGETLIHRKYHCETHHNMVHKDCHDPHCTDIHQQQ